MKDILGFYFNQINIKLIIWICSSFFFFCSPPPVSWSEVRLVWWESHRRIGFGGRGHWFFLNFCFCFKWGRWLEPKGESARPLGLSAVGESLTVNPSLLGLPCFSWDLQSQRIKCRGGSVMWKISLRELEKSHKVLCISSFPQGLGDQETLGITALIFEAGSLITVDVSVTKNEIRDFFLP